MERQSLLDVAVRYCGGAEAAYDLALLNGIGVASEPDNGTLLVLAPVVKKQVVALFAVGDLQPATGIASTGGEGIDFWGIERTFVVN